MVKFARQRPAIFESIQVISVEAPERERRLRDKETGGLRDVLKKCGFAEPEGLISQLGVHCQTLEPEKLFRNRCKADATVHAEMQLLAFYDHHPDLVPPLLFMGTSKKACFLCYQVMERHKLGMKVSACHQKIYPSWMPAPCSDSTVRKQHKELLWAFTRHLEGVAGEDLQTKLGISRRPINRDSTAGPSLTSTGSVIGAVSSVANGASVD